MIGNEFWDRKGSTYVVLCEDWCQYSTVHSCDWSTLFWPQKKPEHLDITNIFIIIQVIIECIKVTLQNDWTYVLIKDFGEEKH